MENSSFEEFIGFNADRDFYVYGAGVVAYYFSLELFQKGIKVKEFVVSNGADGENELFGLPVKNLEEVIYDLQDAAIVVATLPRLHSDIAALLQEVHPKQIHYISDTEYLQARVKYPSMDGEVYQVVTAKMRPMLEKLEEQERKKREFCSYYYQTSRNTYTGADYDTGLYLKDWMLARKESDRFQNRVRALISGLKVEDKVEVLRIIGRLNCLMDGEGVTYDGEENKQALKVQTDFTPAVYQIANRMYAYKDYLMPVKHFEPSVFYYHNGADCLSEKSMEYINASKKDIIDAGAYVGDSAIVFRRIFSGKIYSFEAYPKNFEDMKVTLQMNGAEEIIPVAYALSDQRATEKLFLNKGVASTANSFTANGFSTFEDGDSVEVQTISLDEYVAEHDLHVGLIKTDVEGAEQKLLRGGVNTIITQRPVLLISIYHNIDDFFEIKPWLQNMNLGYSFKIIRPILNYSFFNETMLLAEPKL